MSVGLALIIDRGLDEIKKYCNIQQLADTKLAMRPDGKVEVTIKFLASPIEGQTP